VGSVIHCDPAFQNGAQFIARGFFNPRTLLWFQKNQGFFWTRDDGSTISGRTCLAKTFVEQTIAGK
jgi:hypothetical protein